MVKQIIEGNWCSYPTLDANCDFTLTFINFVIYPYFLKMKAQFVSLFNSVNRDLK